MKTALKVWTSTAGTDTVLDALSSATVRGDNADPFDTGDNALSYTLLAPEPAPGSMLATSAPIFFQRGRHRRFRAKTLRTLEQKPAGDITGRDTGARLGRRVRLPGPRLEDRRMTGMRDSTTC